VFIKIESCI